MYIHSGEQPILAFSVTNTRYVLLGGVKLACKDPALHKASSFLQIRRGNFQNVLQVATSNSNNWGRSVVQNCTSDTP